MATPLGQLLGLILGLVGAALLLGLGFYLLFPRRYQTAASVATAYDTWTQDGILEFYWGSIFTWGTMVFPLAGRIFAKPRWILSTKWCAGAV